MAAMPERLALARAGHRVDEQVQAIREVLMQAVLQGDSWPGVFALAAAVLERHTQDLVRVCVIEDRAAGATWAQIAERFEITPDAARKRWGHWHLAHREEILDGEQPGQNR